MKNIEEQLRSVKRTTPRRKLASSFTPAVIERLEANERKGRMSGKLFVKPLGLALSVAIVIIGGATTFATITNWPSISSMLTGEKQLGSGARIVKIETEGCTSYDDPDVGSHQVRYYEIKKDSPLTNEKAVGMMRGRCEEERAQSRFGELFKQTVEGKGYGTSIYQIEQISKESITIAADKQYEGPNKGVRKTYANIAPNVRVSDSKSDLDFDDLKPGDSVILAIEDLRDMGTEMQGYVEDEASEQVKGILKVPPLTGSPDLYAGSLGRDFVRVFPSEDGKTFKRAHEFDK